MNKINYQRHLHTTLLNKYDMMKTLMLTTILIISNLHIVLSQNQIKGFWLPSEEKSVVEIYQGDDSFDGKIVWLKTPYNKKGEPHTDVMNPDEKLRNQPILGLNLLNGLVYQNGAWSGKLYSPKRGKTVDVVLSLIEDDRLKLTVSYLGFSKDQYWVRTEQPA